MKTEGVFPTFLRPEKLGEMNNVPIAVPTFVCIVPTREDKTERRGEEK